MAGDYPDWTTLIHLIGADIMMPIDIQGAYIMMPVDIQAQYVTLDIDIVAQTVGNIEVDLVAATVGTLDIDIKAQTIGDITIDIQTQSIGVLLQPDWQSKLDKIFYFRTQQAVDANTYATALVGTVPAGKTYYLTEVFVKVITNPAKLSAYFYRYVDPTSTPLCDIGGECGAHHSFRTPLKIVATGQLKVEIWNLENAERNFNISAFGYYEDN